ncbi:MAG: hypothetical protein KAZ87_00380 [Spirochaetes bacterium]|nr:hypothetical protein [Spirochaetota bacterium]
MKASFSVRIKIRRDYLIEAINSFLAADSKITEMKLISEEECFQQYYFKIVSSDVQKFKICINLLKASDDKFMNIECVNDLEKSLQEGMLKVIPTLPADTPENYEMNILGGREILLESILEAEKPYEISGIRKTAAFISVLNKKRANEPTLFFSEYARTETDSLSASLFSGINAFPFILEYEIIEDLYKTLISFEKSFSSIRILSLDESHDVSIYQHMSENIHVPFLSHYYDEIPLFIITAVDKMLSKHRQKLSESTVGFIGLNSSVMRSVKLLKKMSCERILGFDSNEKTMLSFERTGGLATTAENIFGNCDIVVMIKNCFTDEDVERMRPNLLVVSNLDDEEEDSKIVNNRLCRDIMKGKWFEASSLFSFILPEMIEQRVMYLSDDFLVALSQKMGKEISSDLKFPGPFDDRIKNLIKESFR